MTASRAEVAARVHGRAGRVTGPGYRPEIDGLRALAVVSVVAYHAGVPGFSGGFAGVDVFFVLSGFLITGLLAREVEERGRLSFTRFYGRRSPSTARSAARRRSSPPGWPSGWRWSPTAGSSSPSAATRGSWPRPA